MAVEKIIICHLTKRSGRHLTDENQEDSYGDSWRNAEHDSDVNNHLCLYSLFQRFGCSNMVERNGEIPVFTRIGSSRFRVFFSHKWIISCLRVVRVTLRGNYAC